MEDIKNDPTLLVDDNPIIEAEEQTPAQIENERMFGSLARAGAVVKFPAHLYSFALGQVVSFSLLTGHFSRFGIPLNEWTTAVAVLLGVLFGAVLEYLHHEIPRPGWRMIFEFRKTVKSPGRVVMLLVILAAGYGLTRFSGLLTSMGAESAARHFYEEPDAPDISIMSGAHRDDTTAVARGYDGRIAAVHAKYDGLVDSVRSVRQSGIDALLRKARSDEGLNSAVHKWAPATARNYRRKAADRASAMQAAIDRVNADRAATLSPILADRHVEILAISKKYRSDRDTLLSRHDAQVTKLRGDNDELASVGYDIGGYVVWLLFALSFGLELYDFSRGKKYEGFAFNPAQRFSKAWENFSGIFTDKADHQIKRLEVTRQHLRTRSEAKPFAWPSGRVSLIGAEIVGVGFFVSQTIIESDASYSEATMVAAPWSWVGLLLCVVAFGFTYRKEAREREGGEPVSESIESVPTRADTSDAEIEPASAEPAPVPTRTDTDSTVAEPVPESVPKTPETRVSQEIEDDTDSGVVEMTVDEIKNLKTYCRTNYDRIETAATQAGSDSAREKFKASRAQLRGLGHKVRTGKGVVKKMVKKGGKVVQVSYKELLID